MNQYETLLKFLSYLELDLDESKVFLGLSEKGEQTILQISREKVISRTNVYRIIERLLKKGVIEEIHHGNKKFYKAIGVEKLEILVKEQESRVEYLKKLLPELQMILPTEKSLDQPGTRIKLYEGLNGIKQMIWNTLKANGEVVGYTLRKLSEVTGEEFALKWMQEFSFRVLTLRDIITENYLDTLKSDPLVQQIPTFRNESKYLSRATLNILNQVYIYNDVVSYYHWHEGQIVGVEIYDEKIAKFQKQLFEIAWQVAQST
jgi:sugar-specific transcriptional regulator TrmB